MAGKLKVFKRHLHSRLKGNLDSITGILFPHRERGGVARWTRWAHKPCWETQRSVVQINPPLPSFDSSYPLLTKFILFRMSSGFELALLFAWYSCGVSRRSVVEMSNAWTNCRYGSFVFFMESSHFHRSTCISHRSLTSMRRNLLIREPTSQSLHPNNTRTNTEMSHSFALDC